MSPRCSIVVRARVWMQSHVRGSLSLGGDGRARARHPGDLVELVGRAEQGRRGLARPVSRQVVRVVVDADALRAFPQVKHSVQSSLVRDYLD